MLLEDRLGREEVKVLQRHISFLPWRSRTDRYKAKAFIDTFVYRAGDVAGAQTEGLLKQPGMGLAALAAVAVPLAAAWMALGVWLGYAQRAQADVRPPA